MEISEGSAVYITELIKVSFTFLHYIAALAFFTRPMPKARGEAKRAAASLAVCAALIPALALLRVAFPSAITRVATKLISHLALMGAVVFLHGRPDYRPLIVWCGATASEKLAVQLIRLLRALLGLGGTSDVIVVPRLGLGVNFALYTAAYITIIAALFHRFGRDAPAEQDSEARRSVTVLSLVSTIALVLLSDMVRESGGDGRLYAVSLALIIIICILVLHIRGGITARGRYRQELRLLEGVIAHERRQYEEIKDNIDYINMKCHDLKHQLSAFQGRLTDEEVRLLKEAVEFYDGSVRTGSETVDVVIYEKQLVCREKGISFSYMADGAAFGFMSKSHLYSLLNNALGNAIEATERVELPEKRIVSLTMVRRPGEADIEVSNYFAVPPRVSGGELATSKEDRAEHGLGFRSMKYIAAEYGGTVSYEIQGEIFHLKICFAERGDGHDPRSPR